MKYTIDTIDEISTIATDLVAKEFAEFEFPDPPTITPGMVRNVFKAEQKILIDQPACDLCVAKESAKPGICKECREDT